MDVHTKYSSPYQFIHDWYNFFLLFRSKALDKTKNLKNYAFFSNELSFPKCQYVMPMAHPWPTGNRIKWITMPWESCNSILKVLSKRCNLSLGASINDVRIIWAFFDPPPLSYSLSDPYFLMSEFNEPPIFPQIWTSLINALYGWACSKYQYWTCNVMWP